jgi:NAD(P)-dependent dehydrogenase (short-subunit alcohol dehydrogenase family)
MKYIVLTGAVKDGYGESILRNLNSKGYFVIGTYENDLKEKASKINSELKNIKLIETEHSNRNSLNRVIEVASEYNIDGLVNAQMFFNMENLENFDFDLWDKSLAVNLTAPNYLFHKLRKVFNTNASIITITSTEGFIGSFGASAYACTKAAIHNLVKTHANINGENGIRSNAIAAGWIGGVMDTDEVFNMSRKITPLGRLGTQEEIADITEFLLSEKSSLINGTVITADGGYSGVDMISKYEFEQENQ